MIPRFALPRWGPRRDCPALAGDESSTVSADPSKSHSPHEFRSYRRLLSWLLLGSVSVFGIHLFVSIGVTIARQRQAPPADPAAQPADPATCFRDVGELTKDLGKHLDQFHMLIGTYDADDAARWSNEGVYWRKRSDQIGAACGLARATAPGRPAKMEELRGVWNELRETQEVYTRELTKFSQAHAPRLDRIRGRLEQLKSKFEPKS